MGQFVPHLRGKALVRAAESKSIAFSRYYNDLAVRNLHMQGGHRWPIERAIAEGYERVIWVFKSVSVTATDSSGLPYRLRQDGQEVDDHPLYRVLNKKANQLESGQVFRKRLSAQVMLSPRGAFVQRVVSNGGTIKEFHLLPPDRTEIIPGTDGKLIDHYRLTRRDGTVKNLEPDEVLWFRDPHPLDPYGASTPLEAAGMSVELDHFARLYNVSFMQNDGRPGGVLAVRDTAGGADIDPRSMDRIEKRFGKGPVEAGKLSVIAGELSYTDLATRPRDMQYGQTSANSKMELLAAFGMSEVVLGNAAGRCVDDQTEALTQRGWVSGWDLTTDDTILSMDPADGRLKWGPVHEVYRNPAYDGEMYRLKHAHMDALVTPGHNWAVEARPGRGKRTFPSDDVATLRKVEKLSTHDRIITTGEAESSLTEAEYSTAFVELVGWAVTEGHYQPGVAPCVRIRQNFGESAARIERAVKAAGATYSRGESGGTMLLNVRGEIAAAIKAVAPKGVMSQEFMLSLTAEQREHLIQTMVDADGCRQNGAASWTFAQKGKGAAEAFQFLVTLAGYRSSIRYEEHPYEHEGITVMAGRHLVVVGQRKAVTIQHDTRTVEHYEGLVWCPRTDYGTFISRRNGRVLLTGNTFDNADAEMYNYWTRTIPAHNRILLDGFDTDSEDDLEGYLDTSSIEVLERAEKAKREEARTEVAAGLRSPYSYATKAGYAEEIEDNIYTRSLYLPNGKTPVPTRPGDDVLLGLSEAQAVDGEPATPGLPSAGIDAAALADGAPGAPAIGTGAPTAPTAVEGVDMAALQGKALRAIEGGARPKARSAFVLSAKDAKWTDDEVDPRTIETLETELANTLTALTERWIERAAVRVASPKQRKGTRHWESEYERDTRLGTKALDAAKAVDEETWQEEAEKAVSPIVTAAAIAAAVLILTNMGVTPPGSETIREMAVRVVREVIEDVVRLIGRSAARQARLLIGRVNDADQDGETIAAIKELIRVQGEKMANWADGVAVVGSTGTLNGSRDAAVDAASLEDPDLEVKREWTTKRDNRVRTSHRNAHGQSRGMREPFIVGDSLMRFPGDPLAPAHETAQCRCRLRYRHRRTGRFTSIPVGAAI